MANGGFADILALMGVFAFGFSDVAVVRPAAAIGGSVGRRRIVVFDRNLKDDELLILINDLIDDL